MRCRTKTLIRFWFCWVKGITPKIRRSCFVDWVSLYNVLFVYPSPNNGSFEPQTHYTSIGSNHKYCIQILCPTSNTLYKYGVPPQILYTSMASHMLFASGYLALTKYLGIYGLIILQHRKWDGLQTVFDSDGNPVVYDHNTIFRDTCLFSTSFS